VTWWSIPVLWRPAVPYPVNAPRICPSQGGNAAFDRKLPPRCGRDWRDDALALAVKLQEQMVSVEMQSLLDIMH
jgi:hypothetical protein